MFSKTQTIQKVKLVKTPSLFLHEYTFIMHRRRSTAYVYGEVSVQREMATPPDQFKTL